MSQLGIRCICALVFFAIGWVLGRIPKQEEQTNAPAEEK